MLGVCLCLKSGCQLLMHTTTAGYEKRHAGTCPDHPTRGVCLSLA
jgi:hypothetical protein